MSYDWSKFDVYMFFRCPPAATYRAWSTSAGIASFFVRAATWIGPSGVARAPDNPAHVGDRYEWEFSHGRMLQGCALAAEPDRLFAFEFDTAEVTLRFTPLDSGTLVHLRQDKMPVTPEAMVAEHLNCRGGWIYRLTLLKVLLEFGIDARDTNAATAASVSVFFIPPASQ